MSLKGGRRATLRCVAVFDRNRLFCERKDLFCFPLKDICWLISR